MGHKSKTQEKWIKCFLANMSTPSTLVESQHTIQRHSKAKYWLLTIKFVFWRIPETIYDNIKYLRGQLEYSEHQYLHWQIAVQYFNPTNFHQVKEQFFGAHIEPIYSVSAWNYVWKETTSIDGTQFEMGDNSDLVKEMNKKHKTLTTRNSLNSINNYQEPVELEKMLDLECLEKKMIDMSGNLRFLPSNVLKEISDVIKKAEVNLLSDDALMALLAGAGEKRLEPQVSDSVNALFVQFLQEIIDKQENFSNLQKTFSRAQKSIKEHPVLLKDGRDCLQLKYVGPMIAQIIDRKLQKYSQTHDIGSLGQDISNVSKKAKVNLLSDSHAGAGEKRLEPQVADSGTSLLKPGRNGKKWQVEEIKELESMLKSNSTVEEIAIHFERSNNSIRLKAAALIAEKTNNGCSLKTALMEYGGKIDDNDIQKLEILKIRDTNRKRKRIESPLPIGTTPPRTPVNK